MSEVAMTIGGRIYRVACAAGEEDRVSRLGSAINDKLAAMGNLSGHEAQNLLFAGLLLADEVHEGRDTVARAESEIAAAKALAGSSVGEIEELKAALANRSGELEHLHNASQDAAHEMASLQTRLAELGDRLAERQANESALHRQIEDLTRERDELLARPDTSTSESGGHAIADPDLAPALERLAEMLEQCADKLEGAAPAP